MNQDLSPTLDIRKYVTFLQRWLWLIILGTILAGGCAFAASYLATPIYEASAMLRISEGQKPTGPDYNGILTSERLAKTYSQMLTGKPVLRQVQAQLGVEVDASTVTVTPVRDTQLIEVKVRHADPALAASIANAIPRAFVEQNQAAESARFTTSKQSLSLEMQQLQTDIDAAQKALEKKRAEPTPDAAQIAHLDALLAQHRSTYAGLLRSYDDIRVAEVAGGDSLIVFEPADVPEQPTLPRIGLNTVFGALVGAVVMGGVSLLIEYLDDTLKRPEDVERSAGLSTLATIPRSVHSAGQPLAAAQPSSGAAEAYRVLRTNLEFSTLDLHHSAMTVLVTSAEPHEGKTTTVANLGASLALAGKRVLLVDTDLRRPALHHQFGLHNHVGLTTLYLAPGLDPMTAVQGTTIPGLCVLPAGPIPANPAEVLGFPHTSKILGRLKSVADFLLLDSPPVLGAADATILAQKVDGVMLVAEMGKTRTAILGRAVGMLAGVKAHLLGVVLNKATVRPGEPYAGYYGYYGAHHDPGTGKPMSREHARGLARSLDK